MSRVFVLDLKAGVVLDWAVAAVLYPEAAAKEMYQCETDDRPSRDWAYGGRLIEEHGISISKTEEAPWAWSAYMGSGTLCATGDTPLEAAMRCFVMNKLCDSIEIPPKLERYLPKEITRWPSYASKCATSKASGPS